MPSFKRIVASPAFQDAVATAGAWYLRLVWHSSRDASSSRRISTNDRRPPAIIAMWHGQHFMAPFIKRNEAQPSRQGADLAPPRRRDQRARRRKARHRHHPRLRRAQRRVQPQRRRRRLQRNARGARARLQCRAHRRRAEGRARGRARHRQAGAAFRPADLRGGDRDAAAASSSTIGTAAPINLPFGRIGGGGERADLRAERRRRRGAGSGAARGGKCAQRGDRARLRDRRRQGERRSRERQTAGNVARLPAVFGGDDAVDAAVAGAAAAPRQGARPAPGRAARRQRDGAAARARWSGCTARASAN